MREQLPEIFVDFNRRTAAPDTFVASRTEVGDPIVLGASVLMTDLEDLRFEGYISGVSADQTRVFVTRGKSPVASATDVAQFAALDIEAPAEERLHISA